MMTEGLLIAAVPAAGCAIAYAYQVGYCSEFRLPIEFISLDVVTVLQAALTVALSLFAIAWLGNVLLAQWEGPYASRITGTLFCVLLTAPLAYWAGWTTASVRLLSLFLLNVVLSFWLKPLGQRDMPGYRNKLIAADTDSRDEVTHAEKHGTPPIQRALYRGNPAALAALGLVWLMTAAWLMGGSAARHQWEFFVRPGTPTLVVLRFYGDKALAADFDRKRWRLGRDTHVLKFADGETTFRLENLGVLTRP